jgi:23S rRNA (guanine745-N1)-methyltransferase
MKKIDLAAGRFRDYQDYFQCPICGHSIAAQNHSLICSQGHCFDLSKGGYVNLLPHADQSAYSKSLFLSRRFLAQNGFFQPLIDYLAQSIEKWFDSLNIVILDAGCGEGSHAAALTNSFINNFVGQAIGIDIAKDGIKLAAALDSPLLWCVADLAQLPIQDHCLDVIINILSPANYQQFSRVLKQDGILIKVIPEPDYLQEIRAVAFADQPQLQYSNQSVVEAFEAHMQLISKERLQYTMQLDPLQQDHLLTMTPLTLGLNKDTIKQHLKPKQEITVAYNILAGKNKN